MTTRPQQPIYINLKNFHLDFIFIQGLLETHSIQTPDRVQQILDSRPEKTYMVVKGTSSDQPFTIFVKLESCIGGFAVNLLENRYQLNGTTNFFDDLDSLIQHFDMDLVFPEEDIESLPYFFGQNQRISEIKDSLVASGRKFAMRKRQAGGYCIVLADGSQRRIKRVDGMYQIGSSVGKTCEEVANKFVSKHLSKKIDENLPEKKH